MNIILIAIKVHRFRKTNIKSNITGKTHQCTGSSADRLQSCFYLKEFCNLRKSIYKALKLWYNFLLPILFVKLSNLRVGVMVFNATFNNISVLLVEETGENQRPAASHEQDANSQH